MMNSLSLEPPNVEISPYEYEEMVPIVDELRRDTPPSWTANQIAR
jgi:hypothetical protein